MGQTTGASADPAAFITKCHAEDLDYLVTLRKAIRDLAWTAGFYLRCRETALGLDPDVVGEPDGDHEGPDVPGNLDPPKPVDYR